jgi:integrase/recombinase XerD
VEWIEKNDPDFLLPCLMVYGCLIRPAELKRLRVHHVDLDRQVVTMPAELTKSDDYRTPAIPDWMMPYLLRARLHLLPGKAWLVGKDIAPGQDPVPRNKLGNHWVKMRRALHWPTSKQLYSLRDTGIIQLIRDGVDLLHVMQQAGHKDLSTTNEYVKHAFPHGPAEVRAKATSINAASPIITGTNTGEQPQLITQSNAIQ